MIEITMEELLKMGSWSSIGNSKPCEIKGCMLDSTEIVRFRDLTKVFLCSRHNREYIERWTHQRNLMYYGEQHIEQLKAPKRNWFLRLFKR